MLSKGMGKQIRKRGNNYEVQLAKEFRELGYENCVTSRAESRNNDAKKLDLCFSGFWNVQAKIRNNFISPINIFKEMPKDSNYNVIIHKVVGKGEYVVMEKDSFYEIIKMLKNEKII